MNQSSVRSIKKAKKAALLFREFSQFFLQITLDRPELSTLFVSRVLLSNDNGICTVLFYSEQGQADFAAKLPTLILYKPSLRKALSDSIPGRYTPELVFKFDEKFEQQSRLENLLNKVKSEDIS